VLERLQVMRLWHFVANLNLAILALDHLVTGLAGVLFPDRAAALYSQLFGARFPAGSPATAVLRPWGALGAFAGVVGLFPIYDPVRYRPILFALLLLLGFRLFIRLSFGPNTLQHFSLSSARNYFHIYLIAQCAIVISLQLIWW
jgi:hypothetical protein